MKLIITIIAVLIFLAGFIWFLQGLNVLPGSYMTGNPQWAINGAIAMVIGVVAFIFIRRRK
jgi:hypothetical protein